MEIYTIYNMHAKFYAMVERIKVDHLGNLEVIDVLI